jgi:hypothetical protein
MTISGGNSCIDRPCSWIPSESATLIDLTNAIDGNGTITSFCLYNDFGSSFSVKFKIFRINGSNYEVVYSGGWETHDGSGNNNFSGYSITVQLGDLVGMAITGSPADQSGVVQSSGGSREEHTGDVTSTTTISSWSTESYTISCGASGASSGDDYYVIASGGSDSNGGQNWGDAWATINKGMTDTPTGKTLHIGFGTYASEPSDNKVFPANAITVIFETATTGGGTGTASIEVN